jgi:hypothetical protein
MSLKVNQHEIHFPAVKRVRLRRPFGHMPAHVFTHSMNYTPVFTLMLIIVGVISRLSSKKNMALSFAILFFFSDYNPTSRVSDDLVPLK